MSFIQEQADMDMLVDVVHSCMERVIPALIARIEALEGGSTVSGVKAAQHAKNVAALQRIQHRSRVDAVNAIKIKHRVEAETAKSMARLAAKGRPLPVVKIGR